MIYGSIHLVNSPELAETNKQNVARMMAALEDYPWNSESRCVLANGAFGFHAGCEHSAALSSLDGLTIVADARIDNREQLICDLQHLHSLAPPARAGVRQVQVLTVDDFDPQSKIVNRKSEIGDSELILLAYQKWGIDCAAHLLGDFAFSIWDEPNQRLFCARDFIGARPFYYHHAPGCFVFASDLKALAAHSNVPMDLNLAYVKAALQIVQGHFMHPARTYYQAIEKLPPAHCLTLDASSGLRLWAYWTPGRASERRYPNEQDYVEELRAILNEAVACRATSLHPIGAHITGGLDSTSVAVLTHRALQTQGRAVIGFSWAPPLPDDPAELLQNDERKLVEQVRSAEGFPVHYTRLGPEHILAHARRNITLQPSASLQHELASSEEAARLGVRTMLSGWGGDELLTFNGRGYFSDLLRRGRWITLQRELTLSERLHKGAARRQFITYGLRPLIPTAILRRLRSKDYLPPHPLPNYLRPEFAAVLADAKPFPLADGRERPGVRRMQTALLLHGHLSYRMESWASHGATLGITYAYPLLDQRVVEFVLSIPDHLFFKNGRMRYLYRTAMEGILPDNLRWHGPKDDPALVLETRRLQKEAEEQMRAELLERADNPYANVEQLQAALDAEQTNRDARWDESLPMRERRRLHLQVRAERNRWLAFMNSKP